MPSHSIVFARGAICAACAAAVLLLSSAPSQAKRPPANAALPRRVDNLLSALAQTAAVAEGVVTRVDYEYSDEAGPWTVVTLSDVVAHFGVAPSTIVVRQFGGPRPDGGAITVSDQVSFFKDKRYLLFLRNTSWNLSPVVGELAFRVEAVQGRELLINHEGRAVTAIGDSGVAFGDTLYDAPDRASREPPALRSDAQDKAHGLDRRALVATLRAQLQARGMAVAGDFFDEPGGAFNWKRVRTVPDPAASPAAAASVNASELDTSEPPTSP